MHKPHLTSNRFLQLLDRYLGDPCEFVACVLTASIIFLLVGAAMLEVISDAIREREYRSTNQSVSQ